MRSILLAALLGLDAVSLVTGDVTLRACAALLLCLAPGFFLGRILFSQVEDSAARLSLSIGGAFLFGLFFLFAIQALPTIPGSRDIFVLINLLALGLLWLKPSDVDNPAPTTRVPLALCVILVSAAALRLVSLGSAEFQGDESRAVILASGVSNGQHGILFMHKKGPAEALFVTPGLLITGVTNEFAARLAFSLAGLASILALFALVKGFGPKRFHAAALFAAVFLCLDGFHVAFSRIVQYQSTLVFFLLCAALCALEVKKRTDLAGRYSSACAAFCAAALLCHYDAALAFPAIAYLLWCSYSALGQSPIQTLRALSFPAAQFIVLSAAFYVPFLLSEHFSSTAGYLSQRIGANKLPTNNLPRYLELLSFYGGIYQTYTLYALFVLAVLAWVRRYSDAKMPAFLTVICFVLLLWNPSPGWAFLFLGVPCLLVIANSKAPLHCRFLLLWSWTGLTVLGFFFARPNTHFYIVHPAIAALAGIFLDEALAALKRFRILHLLSAVALVGIALLSINYLRVAYLVPEIEYRFAYAKARPFLYPENFKEGLPAGAYFGFQHRSGWKAVGSLIQNGTISGSYGSNEEDLITVWYARGLPRVSEDPDFYFIASRPMDPVKVPQSKIESAYSFWGRVYTDNRRSLDIYSRIKPSAAPQRLDLEQYEAAFDGSTIDKLDAKKELVNAVSR